MIAIKYREYLKRKSTGKRLTLQISFILWKYEKREFGASLHESK